MCRRKTFVGNSVYPEAQKGRTEVWIGDWRLASDGAGLNAEIAASDFGYRLRLEPTQGPLLEGERGYSQKGPDPGSASRYYSIPQMSVMGTIVRRGEATRVTGRAWLDHEWSSAYLDSEAAGWDWIGINLSDGGAVMAFRIRGRSASQRWAGASYRHSDGSVETFAPQTISFTPGRTWLSPRTGIRYPVEWQVALGGHVLSLTPLQDDQESDSRLSTGAVYWEGAVRSQGHGLPDGRGYLELTGYGDPLRLP